MTIDIAINVAPSGLPRCRIFACGDSGSCCCKLVRKLEVCTSRSEMLFAVDLFEMLVFRRNNCVIAMPMLAKDKDVRSHARNVRSVHRT